MRVASRSSMTARQSAVRPSGPGWSNVVHVGTDALKAVYGDGARRSFAGALDHVQSGRIESPSDWLPRLQR